MTWMKPRGACIGAILLLFSSPSTAQKRPDLKAILTRLEGQVTLSSQSRSKFRDVRVAAQRQILRPGEAIHVPAHAQVTLACSIDTLVSLTGPADWVLDTAACQRGVPLPEGSYQNLDSHAGRIIPRNGALLLELETRGVEAGFGPILLSPRNTAVLDANPRLIWTRVPDAAEYQIEVRGQARTLIPLAADGLQCGPGSGPWQGLDVCSWAPSGRWPPLEPDRSVSLKFGTRQTLKGPLRQAPGVYEIRLLSADDQRRVQESLRHIATLHLDEPSRLLLTAGVSVQSGLYADAIAAYYEALQAQEIPEARVTLGDLYLTRDLAALADREYLQAQADTSDFAVQAAAELGRGHVAYSQRRFGDAQAHFERASEIYSKLGLSAEAADAREAEALSRPPGKP